MKWLSRLSTNQRLALAAFLLGLLAIAAAPTYEGKVTVVPQELAIAVERSGDRVGAQEVADWIIQGRADVRLIDLRPASAYAVYHIPSAESIPLATLPEAGLARNERLILYADNGVRAAQGWFLLKARGYRAVSMLDGGLEAWKGQVLFPRLSEAATPEARQRDDRLRALSLRFGGRPLAAGSGSGVPAEEALMPAMPVSPPVLSPSGSRPAPRKKKEGC